ASSSSYAKNRGRSPLGAHGDVGDHGLREGRRQARPHLVLDTTASGGSTTPRSPRSTCTGIRSSPGVNPSFGGGRSDYIFRCQIRVSHSSPTVPASSLNWSPYFSDAACI